MRANKTVWAVVLTAGVLASMPGCGSEQERKQDRKEQGDKIHVGTKIEPDAVAPAKYLGLVVRSADIAKRTECAMRLSGVARALMMYAAENNAMFPPSLDDLVRLGYLDASMTQSPVPEGGPLTYIPGQRADMPSDNVLVYDARVVYVDTQCAAYVAGYVESVSPEALEAAVQRTRQRLGQ